MFGVKELTYVLDWGNRVYEKKRGDTLCTTS